MASVTPEEVAARVFKENPELAKEWAELAKKTGDELTIGIYEALAKNGLWRRSVPFTDAAIKAISEGR